MSAKRKQQNAEYSKLRLDFLKANPVCQVCCSEPSNQIHHRAGREGSWLTDITEFLAVCPDCHDHIEKNREWAKEMGYLKLRLTSDQLNQNDQ